MTNRSCMFISVAVLSIVQSIAVLIIDFPVSICLLKYETLVEFQLFTDFSDGIMYRALMIFYKINEQQSLAVWSIFHLVLHLAWIVSSCILIIYAIKPNPRKSSQVQQFAIFTIFVCMCDFGATCYTAIYITLTAIDSSIINKWDIGAMCFFPLFFSKVAIFWIYNVSVAIVILVALKKIRVEAYTRHAATQQVVGLENPIIAHPVANMAPQERNDFVDNHNYYTIPIQEPPPEIQPAITYKSPMYRPPYLDELQRHSIQMQTPNKPQLDAPEPDYY